MERVGVLGHRKFDFILNMTEGFARWNDVI